MKLIDIQDITFGQALELGHDVAILGCGYESRARHIATLIEDHMDPSRTLLWGFNEFASNPERITNERYFESVWGLSPSPLGGNDLKGVYAAMRAVLANETTDVVRMLVDYSSMSSAWYAGIVNALRHAELAGGAEVDFVYTPGSHENPASFGREARTLSDIGTVPGCDGLVIPRRRTAAFFGLGFDELAPVAVFERLEPGLAYAFYAEPGSEEGYGRRTLATNKQFLSEEIPPENVACTPLGAVEGTFRVLGELCARHTEAWNVVLVPLGPKPHVLASILVAHHLKAVSCIRTQMQRLVPNKVSVAAPPVATRVRFSG